MAGVSTQIGTVAGAKTSGTYYTLKLVVNGSSLACYLNGVLILTISNSQLVTGKPGLFAVMGLSALPFDDFECTDAIASGGGDGGGSVARAGLLGVG